MSRNKIRKVFCGVTALTIICSVLFSSCGLLDKIVENSITDVTQEESIPTLYINEYITDNKYALYDSDGDYSDWVEIYNSGDKTIILDEYYLSDNIDKPSKWGFPKGTEIKSKAYMLIFLSGKDKVTKTGEIHTNFKLSTDDRFITIFDKQAKAVDKAEIVSLPDNVSYGRNPDNPKKWYYYTVVTPGAANTETGYENLEEAISYNGSSSVIINEAMAVGTISIKGKVDSGWIELYNKTDKPVSLKGFGLCKSLDATKEERLVFGEKAVIEPDGYLVITAAGKAAATVDKADKDDDDENLSAPFKISTTGETFYILNEKGQILDSFETGKIRMGMSSGRDGENGRMFFSSPSKGKKNSGESYKTYAVMPVLSVNGGYAAIGDKVSVTDADRNKGEIRYTTDGSEPSKKSSLYENALNITEDMCLKLRRFDDGKLPSDTVTASFITNRKHNIPVVCLTADPDDLFGHEKGIMAEGPGFKNQPYPYVRANFWQDWERPGKIEYFDKGKKQLEFNCGLKVFGQYTRTYESKSLAVNLRDCYGQKDVTYPFFKDNKVNKFENFVLRSGGQDQRHTKLRDAFCMMVMKGHTTLAYMDWKPVALYINGQYWGLYELREKINESYFESHEGLDKNNIDIIKGNSIVLAGTYDEYFAMKGFIKTHDMSKKENYDYVAGEIDVDTYIDYLITEIYFANSDPGNIKFYREHTETAKWKWVMFDFDMGLGTEALWTTQNTIKKHFNPEGFGSGSLFFTTVQCGLLKNKVFRDKFINRYAELLNTVFKADYMNSVLDGMVEQVRSEIPYNAERWETPSVKGWDENIKTLRKTINGRRAIAVPQFQEFFDLSDARMKELLPNG